jgi:hypothetical protein
LELCPLAAVILILVAALDLYHVHKQYFPQRPGLILADRASLTR